MPTPTLLQSAYSPPPRRPKPALTSPLTTPRRPRTNSLLLEHPLTPTSNIHTFPLLFALLPAVAGLLITDGSALLSDLLLLLLTSIFLHWLTQFPWYVSRAMMQRQC